jgi:UDP-glucose 4-epimerase
MKNVDFVLHAAAMKQVPACEQNPIEALKTNVLGSDNVLEASIKNKVKKVVCISTDKAVNPTSVMGITKLYMEKIALAKAKE